MMTGKCDTCKKKKTLDSMIPSDITGSSYHCKDCECKILNTNYYDPLFERINDVQNNNTKIKGVLAWFIGN